MSSQYGRKCTKSRPFYEYFNSRAKNFWTHFIVTSAGNRVRENCQKLLFKRVQEGIEVKMGSTQELLSRIRELELENMELKSKVDQYQSIFKVDPAAVPEPASSSPAGPPEQRTRRANRGLGISAEPQSLRTLTELTSKTFPEFKKKER